MVRREEIEFNGMKFYRYPDSKYELGRKYFSISNKNLVKKGITTLHREIWKYHKGKIPHGYHVHHIDGNHLNNDLNNLECLSPCEHRLKHQSETERKNASEKAKRSLKERVKTKKNCLYCGNEFLTVWKYLAKFCCASCTTMYRKKSGKDDIEKECVICKNIFKCNKHNKSKGSYTATCSRKCADLKSNMTKEKKKEWGVMSNHPTA